MPTEELGTLESVEPSALGVEASPGDRGGHGHPIRTDHDPKHVSFARGGRLRNELYIDTGSQEENDHIFETLAAQRATLERRFGGPLEFEALKDKRAARIADYRDGDVADEANHQQFIDWFVDSGRRLRSALTEVDLTRL